MHILPGRVRLRFEKLKNDTNIAKQMQIYMLATTGVKNVTVNTRTGSCLVLFQRNINPQVIINRSRQFFKDRMIGEIPLHNEPEDQPMDTQLKQLLTGGAILTLFWGLPPTGATIPSNLPLPISSAALVYTGYPIIKSGINHLRHYKRPNYDFWVIALTLFSTIIGKGYVGILTLWLSTLSNYLQDLTLKLASNSFRNTMIKKGSRISLFNNGQVKHVLPGDVNPGDIVLFKAGDCVPLEGKIISGQAQIFPQELISEGNILEANNVLEQGEVLVRVHRIVEDTSLARLADILNDAVEKPHVGNRLAVTYAEKLLPLTVLSTGLVFMFTRDIYRAIPILLAGAPGPAGLASPTAFSASIGLAAGMGVAVKSGTALEQLSQSDVVIFSDKMYHHGKANIKPIFMKLKEDGFKVKNFDVTKIYEKDVDTYTNDDNPLTIGHNLTDKLHRKGLSVAWVSGPENPLFVKNADVNVMILTGKEKELPDAHIICYKNDPKQIYRIIALGRKTIHTIKENVFWVQGMNITGELLGAMGIITPIPAVGLTFLTTMAVVWNSAHSILGMRNYGGIHFLDKGTIEGLSTDKQGCFFNNQ